MRFRPRPGLGVDWVEGILEDMERSIGIEIEIYGLTDLINCFIGKNFEIK